MISTLRYSILILISLAFVASCAPSATSVSLNIAASGGSNGGLPVKATVFYLTSTGKFNSSDYNTLASNPQAALGADLLRSNSVLLSPGQSKSLSTSFDGDGPAAVGVIVGFKAISSAKWRTSANIKSGGANQLTVSIGTNNVSISK